MRQYIRIGDRVKVISLPEDMDFLKNGGIIDEGIGAVGEIIEDWGDEVVVLFGDENTWIRPEWVFPKESLRKK